MLPAFLGPAVAPGVRGECVLSCQRVVGAAAAGDGETGGCDIVAVSARVGRPPALYEPAASPRVQGEGGIGRERMVIRPCNKYTFPLQMRYRRIGQFEYECWPPICSSVSVRDIP